MLDRRRRASAAQEAGLKVHTTSRTTIGLGDEAQLVESVGDALLPGDDAFFDRADGEIPTVRRALPALEDDPRGGRLDLRSVAAMRLEVTVSWIVVRGTPIAVDSLFRALHFASAALYSLGHGGNDAQKTVGIISGAVYVLVGMVG